MNRYFFLIFADLMVFSLIFWPTVSTCIADMVGEDGVYRGPARYPRGPGPKHRYENRDGKEIKKLFQIDWGPSAEQRQRELDHARNLLEQRNQLREGSEQSDATVEKKLERRNNRSFYWAEIVVLLIALGSIYGLYRIRSGHRPENGLETHE